jgi:GT2 family glycosyltransferase
MNASPPDADRSAPGAPVSVVIPCFRCQSTIRRAVESVARQSLRPDDLILIDDGSGDGTLELLRDLQREFGERWLKIIALEGNSGPASARNAGWDAATGRYVAFLDADDAWHPRKIEIQFAFMEARPEVALCGHAHRRLRDGDPLDTPLARPGSNAVSVPALLLSNRFTTPSVMVRREVPNRFLPGKRHMEDHLLWIEIALEGRRIARLDEVLAFTFKPPVGGSGLSANAWAMRKAELGNYWTLRGSGRLGLAATLAFCAYSLAKHLVRSALLARGATRAARDPMRDRFAGGSPADPDRVSISVISHGHAPLIASLLADIAAHVRTPIEVILTLNLPETLPFEAARFAFPLRIVENAVPRGFAANQNAAFHLSRGGFFCALNPDVRIERDPFPELVKCFRDRSVGVAAPLIRNPAGVIEDSARRFPTPVSILRKAVLHRAEVDYPIDAALGGFDERYFLYYEDVNLCARLMLAGKRVALCPSASAIHDARRQSLRSLRYMRWHLSSMMRYFLFWAAHLALRRVAGERKRT